MSDTFVPNKFEPIKGLHKIEKVDYRRWALDKNLYIVGRQAYNLEQLVAALKDYTNDWESTARQQMTTPLKMDKHINVYLLSNGVHSFVLLVDDMQRNGFSQRRFENTGEQEITIFMVKETR